jgi:hypothetical protein
MNKRVLKFAVAVELMTSFWLYSRAPTDGVRVWYPSVWAYMGEHGLVWATVFAVLIYFGLRAFKERVRSDILTTLAAIVAEPVSTGYVWFVIPLEGDTSRAWYTGRFIDYFKARSTAWCVLAVFAAIFYLYFYFRRWRTEEANPHPNAVGS